MPIDIRHNPVAPGKSLKALLIRTGNRLTDRLLRVNPAEVLNSGPPLESPENIAQVLMQTAKAMKAEAIDPHTGRVDYKNLANSESIAKFREITRSLPNCHPTDLGDRAISIAFWINLYNALILDAVVHYQIQGSLLRDIGLFRRAAYRVAGMRFSADDIEHGVLRGNRRHPALPFLPFAPDDSRLALIIKPPDPRAHFAISCGASSCPPIAFYDGPHLEAQLDLAAASFIRGGGARFDPSTRTLWLSKIFQWYQEDFGGRRAVLQIVQDSLKDTALLNHIKRGTPLIRYLPYDWSVNAVV